VFGTTHAGDAVAAQAQADNTNAYLNLAGRPTTINLTGQDLGGLILGPGVYKFDSSAQLTGVLTLNGQGNPNSVFIFNIDSALTTAPASSVLLINGAQGGNVFWRVGSTATLDTATFFKGDILALTSIVLNNAARLECGAAWAQTAEVTLINNIITICAVAAPSASSALPPGASQNQRAVAAAIDAFVANGGMLPAAFADLLAFLSPAQLAAAFTQLSGEAGTGAAQAATQAMNSFLSLVTNPFPDNRPFAEDRSPVRTLGFAPENQLPAKVASAYASINKAPVRAAFDPRRWGVWAAAYGGHSNAAGDPFGVGSHDRSVRTFGYATGLDYQVTPYTVAGFALAGGRTNYGLSDGLGGGHSDMFQAAVYSSTRINAAYVSAALAYAWHRVSTDRYVTLTGTDHLTADFSANNFGGRIESGYRFAIPGVLGWPGQYGITPYAAGQVQTFRTPSYSEGAASGSSIFALTYNARTTTTARTELGARFDWSMPINYDTMVTLRARAAWAHDYWSSPDITASFQALPGASFTVTGAAPARDLLLASAGAEIGYRNGFSLAAWFDGEFAGQSQKYAGTGRLRYTW
jgi:outer membrane autotransporter protein